MSESLLRYDPYTNAPPLAIPTEKKHCPSAASIDSALIFEKSTFMYHLTPSIAFGRVIDLTTTAISIMNNAGIINLQAFSNPSFKFLAEMTPIMIVQINVNIKSVIGESNIFAKFSVYCAAVNPVISPVSIFTR